METKNEPATDDLSEIRGVNSSNKKIKGKSTHHAYNQTIMPIAIGIFTIKKMYV